MPVPKLRPTHPAVGEQDMSRCAGCDAKIDCDNCEPILDGERYSTILENENKSLRADLSTMRGALDEAEKALQDSKDFIQGRWPDVECNTIDKALARLQSVREVKNG